MSRQYLELTQSQERGCFMSLFTLCGSRIAILWPGKRGNGLSVALCGWLWVKCFHSLQAVSFPVTSSNKVGTKKWRSQRASIVPVYQWLTVSWGLCVPLFIWGNSCEWSYPTAYTLNHISTVFPQSLSNPYALWSLPLTLFLFTLDVDNGLLVTAANWSRIGKIEF